MLVSLFLFSAVVGLIVYFVFKIKQDLNHWRSHGIPCEEPHWIFGNFRGIRTSRSFAEVWIEYYDQFKGTGPFAGFYWFQKPAAFVLETELAKNVLVKDFHKFTDRGIYTNVKDDPLTGTLTFLDGQSWKVMRHKTTPTFTSAKMKFMFPTVTKVGVSLAEAVDDLIKKSAIQEIKDIASRYTMDVIALCAFGIDSNSLSKPEAEFLAMGKRALVDRRHNDFILAFMNNFPNLARKLHLKQTPEHIEEFYMRIVKETVDSREKNNIRRNDFMDMLLELKKNQTLSLGEIAAQTFVFLIAGFNNSANTMSFALYELAQHEDIQNRVREEINSVLEKHDQQFTYECMKELLYLNQIISETLRLHTVVPVLNRVSLSDYVVPGHPKYVIKKGMRVLIPTCAVHRDPDFYQNPNDFNPDNFAPESVKERDPIQYMPFGDGPRNCIGNRFGLMQTRIGLAKLLKNFKFSVCPETQIPLVYDKNSFSLNSEHGIYLKIEKVKGA